MATDRRRTLDAHKEWTAFADLLGWRLFGWTYMDYAIFLLPPHFQETQEISYAAYETISAAIERGRR